MITRGSKFFYGAGVVALLSALLFGFVTAASRAGGVFAVFSDGGIVQAVLGPVSLGWKGSVGEHIGYVVLLSFSAVMFVLGGFMTAFRDADAEAIAQVQGVAVVDLPAATAPFGLSWWPVLAAASAGVVVVGLAFSTILFYVGLVGLLVAGFEWTVRAWSERATGDPALNAEYRNTLMRPVEVPVGAVLVIAVVALAVSRILLALTAVGATFAVIILAAVIFGIANLLASRPELKRSVLMVVLIVGAAALIGGGIAGGLAGQSEVEHSEEGSAVIDSTGVPTAVDTGSTGTEGY